VNYTPVYIYICLCMQSLFSARDNTKQCKCNKITSCIRISANIITSGFISSQFASMVFTKNRNLLAPSKDPLSSSSTFSQSSSICLTHTRGDRARMCSQKRTSVQSFFCSRLHHDTTFKLVVAHPPIVSPRASSHLSFSPRRISTWLFFDGGFDIDMLYPREYITGLPSNTHTNALRPPTIRRARRVYTRL